MPGAKEINAPGYLRFSVRDPSATRAPWMMRPPWQHIASMPRQRICDYVVAAAVAGNRYIVDLESLYITSVEVIEVLPGNNEHRIPGHSGAPDQRGEVG